jgi:hypothetical protein
MPHRITAVPFPGGNLLFAAREQAQKLAVLFGPCLRLGAHHDGCSSAPLGNDNRLLRLSDLAQHRRGILSQIRDRSDRRDFPHAVTSYRMPPRPIT